MKLFNQFYLSIHFFPILLILNSCNSYTPNNALNKDYLVKIGVAWRADTTSTTFQGVINAIKEVGAVPVVIGPVFSPDLTYNDSMIADECVDKNGILLQKYADIVKNNLYNGLDVKAKYLNGIDAMVFPGGEDMSPTLFSIPQRWHGIESEIYYDATRDISDYILMQWCLDNDMPSLCICRGMQVLAILSGSSLIQDINTYFSQQGVVYNHSHRGENENGRFFASHDVIITDSSSLLFDIVQSNLISDAPSWHHQAVETVDSNLIKVTAITKTNKIDIIEAIERKDKSFFVGVQYHPEISVKKHLKGDDDADRFMSYKEGIKYFQALEKHVKHNKRLKM